MDGLLSDHFAGVAEFEAVESFGLDVVVDWRVEDLAEPPLGPRGGLKEPLVAG